jgi:hypothetical protein
MDDMKSKSRVQLFSLLLTLLFAVMIIMPITAKAAPDRVLLGTAESFAVLAGQAVTNTGLSVITGDIGVSPGSSVGGFPPGTVVNGTIHSADAVAQQAQADLTTAYLDAAGRTPTTTFTETDNQLGGKTLTSGVYAFGHADTANITAADPLILDAEGDPDAVFIFQSSSDLVTASGSEVRLINGAQFCRVFWQVTSSATLGTNSTFIGHILALTSITAATGAEVQGQLLARNGTVTLDTNVITNGPCTATLYVIKNVVNDDGRTAVASDFSIHVLSSGVDVDGSPQAGAASPGTVYYLAPGDYVISEGTHTHYTVSYSGDSDASGNITLASFDSKTVTVTNNDITINPRTGDYTADDSWIGITAAVIGGMFVLIGTFLYLRRQKSETGLR